jgi:2',3'-cyclic-nucleotide 2'-phosphodiesterase (5'-nucleotidase family)
MPRRIPLIVFAILVLGACASRTVSSAPGSYELIVLSTTDVHGRLVGWDYTTDARDTIRGLARVATVADSIRALAPGRVVLVDAGDLLQGNPLAYVAARVHPRRPHPVVAAMNAAGYDAAAIGNHEFNFGLELLEHAAADADFAFLAANAYRTDGSRAYHPWRIMSRGPVRVGIVGATTPGAMIWDRDHLTGHVELRDMVSEVRRAADEARSAGADIVVAVVHGGLNEAASYDTAGTGLPGENVAARLAHEVPDLALIVYGHSHRRMADTLIAGTRLIQPAFWASSVGVARLELRRTATGWEVVSSSGELVPVAGRREHAGVVSATQAVHDETRRYVNTPIGSTPVRWRSDSARVRPTPLVDFVLEVQRQAAGAELSAGAAFSLSAELMPGNITLASLARLYPYENTLRSIRITGRQLRQYLEYSSRHFGTWGTDEPVITPGVPGYNFDIVSGVEYTIDLSRPVGSRIVSLTRNGRTVADEDSFSMALNNYRQSGGGGFAMIADAPLLLTGDTELRQLLTDEIRRRGTIRPGDYPATRWRIVPEAAAQRAYSAMHEGYREGGPSVTPSAEGTGTQAAQPARP